MRTVAETPILQRYTADVLSDSERIEFINWIALHPEAGDVIPGSGGCRKVRWQVRQLADLFSRGTQTRS